MIHTLDEFTSEVKNLISKSKNGFNTTTLPWFRGQSDEKWELTPSIYRMNGKGAQEREMIRDFILNNNFKKQKNNNTNLELLFLMQHHGMPTRLLDWSESFLIALYFAVMNFRNESNSAVWAFFPWELNEVVLPNIKGFNNGDRTVPTSLDKRLKGYEINPLKFDRQVKEEYPLAIRPLRTSDRITAQKGMFTIHGFKRDSLNTMVKELNSKNIKQIDLIKIIISGKAKLSILKELYISGITHSLIFPELEGICQEISFRYSDEFTGFNDGHKFFGFK